MSVRVGEANPVGEAHPIDGFYVDLPQIEGENDEERIARYQGIATIVRIVLAQQALSPSVPPRSLREKCCESLRRCCQIKYISAFAGTYTLATSVFFFVLGTQVPHPSAPKIFYPVGTACLGLSACMFRTAYRDWRRAV